MASIGEKLTNADLEEMVREMDDNQDGEISYREFVKWVDGDRATSPPKGAAKQGSDESGKLNAQLESVGLPKLLNMRTSQVSRWHKLCSREGKKALNKARRKFRDKCRGFVEFGFSSATPDKHVALDYSSALACKGKCCDGWKACVGSKSWGLTWKEAGAMKPTQGRELSNPALASTLESKAEFTQQEWSAFGIGDLRPDDFIRAGGSYFRPLGEFCSKHRATVLEISTGQVRACNASPF